jgi:MtrB/PioB family decaheme-associated outer membrane protein
MNTRSEKMKVSGLHVAVHGALAVLAVVPSMAYAADPSEAEIAVIRRPTNYIQAGIENVSQKSAKFGEYNGLNKAGGGFVGNFSVRGGDAYEGGDGTMRWGVVGTDIGTTSREFGATVGNQGKWDLSIGYDELKRNISNTYQTPLQGSMGGNTFVLPTNFGNLNGAAPAARALTPAQLGAFHTEEVSTTRKNTSFAAGFILTPELSLKFDFNHLDQSGAKLMGVSSQGGIAIGASTGRAEAVNIVMNPTNYKTDNFNLALNWIGEKGHLTAGYYGSIFRDGFNSVTSDSAMTTAAAVCAGAACFVTNVMSTMPSNNLHQLNLTGGWNFSPATKLVGGFSYARNTQNDNYAPTLIPQGTGVPYNMMQAGGLPATALNGLVITRHADLKLTNRTTKDLTLSAAFKFNERDNRTASNTYLFKDLGNANYTGVNTPFSNKKTQLELAGDYRVSKEQTLRLAYERENIKRWCDGVVGGLQCVVSPSSHENKLGLTYRLKATDELKLNAGVGMSDRVGSFDHTYASNAGSYPAINGKDSIGFVAHPFADRKQYILKAGLNWQATEKLEFALGGRFSENKYNTEIGVQDGQNKGVNLDATYSYSDTATVSAYVALKKEERGLKSAGNGSATVVPTQFWTNQLRNSDDSFGITTKHTGLMGGKLEVLGDLSYSFDKSRYSTQVPYLATCAAAGTLTCGDTPDIMSKLLSLKITGTYQLDKSSKIALAYQYQRLKSDDFYYNSYQYGFTPNRVMPTNEQAPNYSVNVVALSYIYNFK